MCSDTPDPSVTPSTVHPRSTGEVYYLRLETTVISYANPPSFGSQLTCMPDFSGHNQPNIHLIILFGSEVKKKKNRRILCCSL